MKPRQRRLAMVAGGLGALAAASALVLSALRDNLVFFFTPSQVEARQAPLDRTFRIGGLVEARSVRRDGLAVQFTVTDTVHALPVRYRGALPDLFREGKGVVANGRLAADGVFAADQVLAKHDENYMPRESMEALKQAGQATR